MKYQVIAILILLFLSFANLNYPQSGKHQTTKPSSKSSQYTSLNKKAQKIKTGWDENKLKDYFKTNIKNEIEGIYEFIRFSSEDKNLPKYKIGIKAGYETKFDIIYLAGLEDNSDWEIGDLKGEIFITATENLYTVKWYTEDRLIDEDVYCQIDELNLLKFIFLEFTAKYLKLYPTKSGISYGGNEVKSSATAFALTREGLLVTSQHVIDRGESIWVRGVKGNFDKVYKAIIVVEDKNNDLAIIKISDPLFDDLGKIPFIIRANSGEVGESVFALGYPLTSTMGYEIKVTDGIISSKTGFQGDVTSYQFSAPVQPGNSGGPLFDKNGELLGIISSKHTSAESVSYAVKNFYLKSLIESLPKIPNLQTKSVLHKKSLVEKLKVMRDFVYIVELR